jgi:hypothetical protein
MRRRTPQRLAVCGGGRHTPTAIRASVPRARAGIAGATGDTHDQADQPRRDRRAVAQHVVQLHPRGEKVSVQINQVAVGKKAKTIVHLNRAPAKP